jgi:hypothetical protein
MSRLQFTPRADLEEDIEVLIECLFPALVRDGTWFPKPGVAGPIPAEGT